MPSLVHVPFYSHAYELLYIVYIRSVTEPWRYPCRLLLLAIQGHKFPLCNQVKPCKWVSIFPVRENSGNSLGKQQNSGNLTLTRRERFSPVWHICASCAMCPTCVHWLTGYGGFLVLILLYRVSIIHTSPENSNWLCYRSTSWRPSNFAKLNILLMKFWKVIREISIYFKSLYV